jgi:hypothetical protein
MWRSNQYCPDCGALRGKGRLAGGVVATPPPVPDEVPCPVCKAILRAGQSFCPKCGAGAATGTRRCTDDACGAFNPGDARFCAGCGQPFAETAKPAVRGETVWARNSADLMARIEVRDVQGILKKGIVIEHGTEALFLLDGRLVGPLEPGRHDLGGLLRRAIDLRLRYEATAVVYDNAEFSLTFPDVKALTRENVDILVDCEVRVHIDNAELVFTTLAKGATQYTRAALQEFLAAEVANGMAEAVRPHGVQEFRESFALKRGFEETLSGHLKQTLEHCGLGLAYLRTLNYRQERLDEQSRRIAEFFFESCDITIEADGRRQKLDARIGLLGVERQELAADAENLRLTLTPRLALLEATRNLQAADLENENTLAELHQKYDMAQVSRDMTFDEFIRQATLNKEQTVRMLQEQLDQDYRKLTVVNGTEMARLTGEKRVVEVEQEQKAIRTEFDGKLGRDRDLHLQAMKIAREKHSVEMDTGSAAQDLLAKTMQIARDAELARERGHMNIRVAEVREQAAVRVEEAKGMAKVMTVLKDMLPEQILAIKNPEQFAEVLRANAGKDMVEKYLTMQVDTQAAFVEAFRQQAQVAMEAQARVAATAAERPAAVVYGPPMASPATIAAAHSAAPGTPKGEASGPLACCRDCKIVAPLPLDAKCPRCGKPMFVLPSP